MLLRPNFRQFNATGRAEEELKPLLKAAFDKANELGVNILIAVETRHSEDSEGNLSSDIRFSHRIDTDTAGTHMMSMYALAKHKHPINFVIEAFIPAMMDIKRMNAISKLKGVYEECDCLKCALAKHFENFNHPDAFVMGDVPINETIN